MGTIGEPKKYVHGHLKLGIIHVTVKLGGQKSSESFCIHMINIHERVFSLNEGTRDAHCNYYNWA